MKGWKLFYKVWQAPPNSRNHIVGDEPDNIFPPSREVCLDKSILKKIGMKKKIMTDNDFLFFASSLFHFVTSQDWELEVMLGLPTILKLNRGQICMPFKLYWMEITVTNLKTWKCNSWKGMICVFFNIPPWCKSRCSISNMVSWIRLWQQHQQLHDVSTLVAD